MTWDYDGRREDKRTGRPLIEQSGVADIRDFADLRCYQIAYSTAMKLFELSKSWPKTERYGLTQQIRNSSRSIAASISEAWGKRRYPAHFISKLTDAESECCETRNWLMFAKDCGHLEESLFQDLVKSMRVVSASLVKMMTSPEDWCGPIKLRNKMD